MPEHRQLNVLGCGQRWQQIVRLEDEADRCGAVVGRIAQSVEPLAIDDDRARIGYIERPDQVQQRALARSGGADQRDELPRLDRERHILERRYPPVLEGLADALEDERCPATHLRGVTA